MNKNDPFGNYLDDDKTVLKPSPSGDTQGIPTSETPLSLLNLRDHLGLQSEKNPLFSSSLTLLALVTQLRQSMSHQDIPALREQLIGEMKQFEASATALQCPHEQVQTARYALCSLIDEVILNTPWGSKSIWATESLLVSFHKESWGGEKFFQILKNIIGKPEIYFNLLELFYYCLSLGFEGKYKIQERGVSELQAIRENLYDILKTQRGELEDALSLQWRGVGDKRNLLARYVPLWVVGAIAAIIMMLIFFGFLYTINQSSAPIISQTFKIKDNLNNPTSSSVQDASTHNYVEQFRIFLRSEIQQKQVSVDSQGNKTVVKVIASNFFGSGGDRIQANYKPLLKKIANALITVNEPVMIVGHTDNDPIFTTRFPSNWDLSNARAKAVADVINKENRASKKIVHYEGRADTQNLVPNNSRANKALNRRIEIIF